MPASEPLESGPAVRALHWLLARPTRAVVSSLAMVLALAAADYLTGIELSFTLFYLAPVGVAAWGAGVRGGTLLALLTAAEWQVANWLAGETFSHLAVPLWNSASRLMVLVVVVHLLVRLKAALERERAASRTDNLTGVANSRAFQEAAERELARCRRFHHPLTMLFFDLDNFKHVNDSLGHGAGDAVLRAVGAVLRGSLRSTDVPARLGGDEFVVLFPETGAPEATAALRKLQDTLLEEMRRQGWPVTFSMGARTFAEPPASVDDLVRAADTLMYAAKAAGKSRLEHRVA